MVIGNALVNKTLTIFVYPQIWLLLNGTCLVVYNPRRTCHDSRSRNQIVTRYCDGTLGTAKLPCQFLSISGLTGIRITVKQYVSVSGTIIIRKSKAGIFFHHFTIFHNTAAGNDHCFTFHFDFFFCFIVDSFYTGYFSIFVHQNICDRCIQHILSTTFDNILHGIQTDQCTAMAFASSRNQIKISMCHYCRGKSIRIFRISDILQLQLLCRNHFNAKTLNIFFCSPGIVYILTNYRRICIVIRILI